MKPLEETVEKAAKEIYAQHSFGLNQGMPTEGKPEWVPHGNSLKQEEARGYAMAAIDIYKAHLREQGVEKMARALDKIKSEYGENIYYHPTTKIAQAALDALLGEDE